MGTTRAGLEPDAAVVESGGIFVARMREPEPIRGALRSAALIYRKRRRLQ